jgi:hypothetical protein
MSGLVAAAFFMPVFSPIVWETRIDIYDPATGEYAGSETTGFAPDGRRLRQVNAGPDGQTELEFLVLHDERGRERSAWFWEGESDAPWNERFTYSDDGRTLTITYYTAEGEPSDITRVTRDESERERKKAFLRSDGTQYGEEDVLWTEYGNMLGWDFRYTERPGSASFRYDYLAPEQPDTWTVRIRSRNGEPERLETQTRTLKSDAETLATPAPFLPGLVSSPASETSPSFTEDGQTMVFARYEEWDRKTPYIARRSEDGWEVSQIEELGEVYNLSVSENGQHLVIATLDDGPLLLYTAQDGTWMEAQNLTTAYEISGGYGHLNRAGNLIFYDADGADGEGLYQATVMGADEVSISPVFVPEKGVAFDAIQDASGKILFTYCQTDSCARADGNGVFVLGSQFAEPQIIPSLDYVWGVQPVSNLGILVFTDGDDILSVPLQKAGQLD